MAPQNWVAEPAQQGPGGPRVGGREGLAGESAGEREGGTGVAAEVF